MKPAGTQAQDQLRLLVDAQTEYAMFLLDPEGRVATWNLGAQRIKGYEPEEIIGEHFSRFYTEEDLARNHPEHELQIARAAGRYEEEGWRVRKDGSRFWSTVVITALYDETGTLVGYGKVTRDLTSRRLAEEQLRLQAADLTAANERLMQFRLLVASVRDYAIFMLDPGGYIQTWNAGAEALKGYTEAEAVGMHFSRFYTEPDRERQHPAYELEVATRVGRFEEEGWRVRKDGTTFWANVVITALRNEHGVLVGFAKVTRDLTERRAAEQELRATAEELALANAELAHFASIAAHDLVEPLHTMHGIADLLERRYAGQLEPEARNFLGIIGEEATRLRALVDGLLEYARAGKREVRHQPVQLGAVVEEVVDSLGARIAERDATVRCDWSALPTVSGDRALIGSIVQNLVANALKFGGPQPHVELTAEPAEEGFWRVVVSDDGIGIPPVEQERIFDLFHRLHPREAYSGTGLGLALTQRLVDRHGGRIGVDSTPGEGSRFWFTLPTGQTS
jgi:PAS domain S-box-containing protein